MKNIYLTSILLFTLIFSSTVFGSIKLNSLPYAAATIYLDFDGYSVANTMWRSGKSFICAPTLISDIAITEVFNRVSEDYRPFNINITTDSLKYSAAPIDARIRVIITPSSSWISGAGGIAFIGSFTWGDDTPCFVFSDKLGPNNTKYIAESCSHESGHTLGLSHQASYDGNCNLNSNYNSETGTGEIAWAPIMGNSYYRNMSGWNNGPTPDGCIAAEDNLSIITNNNGFTYREDDYTDNINGKPNTIKISETPITGIISTSTDMDVFRIRAYSNTNFHIKVDPYSINSNNAGANLDVKAALYNEARILIKTFDPTDKMNVEIDTVLGRGNYFLVVQGAGNKNVSNYGSLGSYTITGSEDIVPIKTVSLTAKVDRDKYYFDWKTANDEDIKIETLESSLTGNNFSTLSNIVGNTNSFDYLPFQKTESYYRIKIISSEKKVFYSNTVSLKIDEKNSKLFKVSTFTHNNLIINATENYYYFLSDINGIMLLQGKGKQGFNQIDLSHQTTGVYVLQFLGSTGKQVEKIVKE